MTNIDFNSADTQDSAFALIPANTLAKVYLTIRPGGAGPEGWLTQSKTSEALYLNTEAVIEDGPHARRRIYTRIGFRGRNGSDRLAKVEGRTATDRYDRFDACGPRRIGGGVDLRHGGVAGEGRKDLDTEPRGRQRRRDIVTDAARLETRVGDQQHARARPREAGDDRARLRPASISPDDARHPRQFEPRHDRHSDLLMDMA